MIEQQVITVRTEQEFGQAGYRFVISGAKERVVESSDESYPTAAEAQQAGEQRVRELGLRRR